MPGGVFLAGDDLVLATVEEGDLAFLQRWRNHPDIRRFLGNDGPQNREVLETEFEEEISDEDSTHLLVCRATKPDDDAAVGPVAGEPIGAVFLPWTDPDGAMTWLQFWLTPGQGHEVTVATLELALSYLFRERRLHKVAIRTLVDESERRAALEAVGFQQEARIPDEVFVDGAYVDVLRYGLLAAEWES